MRNLSKASSCVIILLVLVRWGQASEFPLPGPGEDLVGRTLDITLLYEDTLAALAQEFDAGYQELLDANPDIDPWLPGAGSKLILPFQFVLPEVVREGIVINLAEYRLYYYPSDGQRVITFPIGLGREGFATPLMLTKIVSRIENPSWTPTASIRREHLEQGHALPAVVPSGPDNPLGKLALQLSAPGYFIHGTNKPFGVGQRVSHGCIRLYSDDIERLVSMAPNGTSVRVIEQPNKLGWHEGNLYLEAHDPLDELGRNVEQAELVRRIQARIAGGPKPELEIDWQKLESVLTEARGIPTRISLTP